MKNNYGLPSGKLNEIFNRDKKCVYCKKKMISHEPGSKRADWYTIEHLNYMPPWNNPATVVICCWSCNSSRGNKKIVNWFSTEYCRSRNIGIETVSITVEDYIREIESKES